MRIILMHNPKGGCGNHAKRDLMAALANAGHHAIYQRTKKGDYKEVPKKPADLVLAAGGDGTVGKVGRELIDSGIPLSVLPLGTANNLGRSLGFTASPKEIITGLECGKNDRLTSALREGHGAGVIFLKELGAACSRIIV